MFPQNNQTTYGNNYRTVDSLTLSKTFLSNVFGWMFLGLLATAGTSWIFADSASLMALLIGETGMTTLGWIVTFAPFGFVLLMGFGFQKLSSSAMVILFMVYAYLWV